MADNPPANTDSKTSAATVLAKAKAMLANAAALPAETKVNHQAEPVIKVKIYAPFKVYYDKEANSVSAENETGSFDILPRHKNFITILTPCEIVVRATAEQDFKLKIDRAVMHVKANMVTIFLDV